MGRSKWIAISVLAVGISLLWKPIVVLAWRASHSSRVPFHAHVLHVGFPWVVVANRGDTVKAETFSTLRPTFKDKYSTVIFGRDRQIRCPARTIRHGFRSVLASMRNMDFKRPKDDFSLMVGSYVLNPGSALDRATTADR